MECKMDEGPNIKSLTLKLLGENKKNVTLG
jgi:hypothetical protein